MAIVVSFNQNATVSGKDTMIAPMERVSVVFSDKDAATAFAYHRNIAKFRQPEVELIQREVTPANITKAAHVKPDWYKAKEVLFWKIKKSEK